MQVFFSFPLLNDEKTVNIYGKIDIGALLGIIKGNDIHVCDSFEVYAGTSIPFGLDSEFFKTRLEQCKKVF